MSTDEQYSLLPTHDAAHERKSFDGDGEVFIDDPDSYDAATTKSSKPAPLWVQICSAAALFLAVLNIVFPHLVPSSAFAPSPHVPTRAERLARANTLYRPNMYIGLDRVDRDTARDALPEALHIFPHVFAPVSRAEPERVFPSDGRARITFNGLVSPGEPHVIINKDVSMIMQIRVQDYNLGRCSLASAMPDPALLHAQNRTLSLARELVNLEVWELDASAGELDTRRLAWATRPARTALLSNLVVQQAHRAHSAEFACGRTGTLHMFELACPTEAADECAVEFWQEQPETTPRMAITIVQKPSI